MICTVVEAKKGGPHWLFQPQGQQNRNFLKFFFLILSDLLGLKPNKVIALLSQNRVNCELLISPAAGIRSIRTPTTVIIQITHGGADTVLLCTPAVSLQVMLTTRFLQYGERIKKKKLELSPPPHHQSANTALNPFPYLARSLFSFCVAGSGFACQVLGGGTKSIHSRIVQVSFLIRIPCLVHTGSGSFCKRCF